MTDSTTAQDDERAVEALFDDWKHASGRLCLTMSETNDLLQLIRAARAPFLSAAQPVAQEARWRPEVVAFADAMEEKLRANDWKGGWKDDASGALMDRVREEIREFMDAHIAYPRGTDAYRANLRSEGADVANMVMMVLDVCGALPAALAAPQPSQGVEGWKLVPIKPTEDMLYKMAEVDGHLRGDRDHPMLTQWEDYWNMALDASPTPPASQQRALSDDFLDDLWRKIQREDDSWEPLPHRKFARAILAASSGSKGGGE